jgi:hypothetical protein
VWTVLLQRSPLLCCATRPFGRLSVFLRNIKGWIELNWIYLHSINPKQVNTFGYRTSCITLRAQVWTDILVLFKRSGRTDLSFNHGRHAAFSFVLLFCVLCATMEWKNEKTCELIEMYRVRINYCTISLDHIFSWKCAMILKFVSNTTVNVHLERP